MNVAIPITSFNANNIFFQDAIKNTVMSNSNFIRVIYSDELCSFNGICLEFSMPITHIDKSFNKYKCVFDSVKSNDIVQCIAKIEKDIIGKYTFTDKQPVYRASEQLSQGVIKVLNLTNIYHSNHTMNNFNKTFIMKISGLWTSDLEYGLTYKFIQF
jgi:hypothetical protein